MQYLKLNNPLYHDIEIDLDNIPSFLINEESQNSLSINVLNNINIDDEIPIIVERSGLCVEEVESDIQSISSNLPIPIFFENCDDTQDSNSINIKNLGKVDITINPISDISDPIDFTIDESVGVVSDRKHERTNSKSIDNNSNTEFNENPLDTYKCSASETVLVNTSCENEFISIAPVENVRPESLTNDILCEELSHPYLFPTGKFGFQTKRKVYLTSTKYFNQPLLNDTQKFSSDSDYIFFVHSVMQKLNLSNQINIAIRKVTSSQLTAGMLSINFNEKVKEFITSNQAFTFMNTIKGTPAYWKKFLLHVFAMVKQLGVPTFFMTLSSVDLKWNELVDIINKLHKLDMSEEDIGNLTYHGRCRLLNSNPVLVARPFQYRVELFFKEIVVDGPLGKTKYYAIRVEFQVRGSPHVHCFLWVPNAPVSTSNNKEEYVDFVDQIVHAFLPDRNENPELHNLVKLYKLHRHS